jgi:putative transposase
MTPRTGRSIVDGGIYHVLVRSNNRQALFPEDADCRRYLELLAASARDHRLTIFHYALLPDHVHLILELIFARSLSRAMHGLNLAYALHYRKHHAYHGHLWRGRFKSRWLNPGSELPEHGRYVELHPVRSGLVADPARYGWTSYRAYADGAMDPVVAPPVWYQQLGTADEHRRERYRQFILQGLNMPSAPPVFQFFSPGRPRKLPSTIQPLGHVCFLGSLVASKPRMVRFPIRQPAPTKRHTRSNPGTQSFESCIRTVGLPNRSLTFGSPLFVSKSVELCKSLCQLRPLAPHEEAK